MRSRTAGCGLSRAGITSTNRVCLLISRTRRLRPVEFSPGSTGRVRLYDSALRETGQWGGWGSDIAAVETGCGGGRAVLASRSGDSRERAGCHSALQHRRTRPNPLRRARHFFRPRDCVVARESAWRGGRDRAESGNGKICGIQPGDYLRSLVGCRLPLRLRVRITVEHCESRCRRVPPRSIPLNSPRWRI